MKNEMKEFQNQLEEKIRSDIFYRTVQAKIQPAMLRDVERTIDEKFEIAIAKFTALNRVTDDVKASDEIEEEVY